jgi:glutathione S-transferase
MLKLYGGPRTRASIVQWYLEELAVPYERIAINVQAGEGQQPEYLAINPLGKVPSIVEGDFKLWETGAILLYLLEKHGSVLSLEQRAIQNQWIVYANATIGPEIFSEATREKQMPRHLILLNTLLEQQPFITGAEFTAADVAVGSILWYIPLLLQIDFTPYPAIASYMQRLGDRPAFKQSIAG